MGRRDEGACGVDAKNDFQGGGVLEHVAQDDIEDHPLIIKAGRFHFEPFRAAEIGGAQIEEQLVTLGNARTFRTEAMSQKTAPST